MPLAFSLMVNNFFTFHFFKRLILSKGGVLEFPFIAKEFVTLKNMDAAPSEKIIVFESYNTTVAANLAKTKLDAYGIPCFLTEENLTNLYPLQMGIFPGVRLHIFERDFEEVKNILEYKPEENFIKCPHCGSVQMDNQHSALERMAASAMFLMSILLPIDHHEYRCKNCEKGFD
jgi:hypothetical protein